MHRCCAMKWHALGGFTYICENLPHSGAKVRIRSRIKQAMAPNDGSFYSVSGKTGKKCHVHIADRCSRQAVALVAPRIPALDAWMGNTCSITRLQLDAALSLTRPSGALDLKTICIRHFLSQWPRFVCCVPPRRSTAPAPLHACCHGCPASYDLSDMVGRVFPAGHIRLGLSAPF